MSFEKGLSFARELDRNDPLRHFRDKFHLPKKNEEELIYLCGNSLGLQPKSVRAHIEQELLDWERLGVEGHFHGKNPWYYYHHFLKEVSEEIVGAKGGEVVIMNSLTANLHFMLASFYRPEGSRTKILIESHAFPSDQYAADSHANWHGLNAELEVVELQARAGETILRTDDIVGKINELGESLALVMLGGVNYYTGQYFELQKITEAAHKVGAVAGFDLAHAAGNVNLKLHDWDVDFAVWCTYKYLNSGPGGTSGTFVHERHADNPELPRLAGWWGNEEKTRFQMPRKFVPQSGAAGWQVSNAQVLPMAAHKASLEIFKEAGMENLCEKSQKMTRYLDSLIAEINAAGGEQLNVITPSAMNERGCQFSILTGENGKSLYEALTNNKVIADWREPNVIRIAPVPLYNTFEELFQFASLIRENIS